MDERSVRDRWKQGPLTPRQVRALPARVDLVDAARALHLTRTVALELVRTGTFPVPLIQVGRRHYANLRDLLVELGMSENAGAA